MKRHAFDLGRSDLLYKHKTKTTAKLIAGLRALEQERPVAERRFDDPYAGSVLGIGEAIYNHYGFCVLGRG